MKRTAPLSPLPLLLLVCLGSSATIEAQSPPCRPCAGLSVADPSALVDALAAPPAIDGEARLYVAWPAELKATPELEAALAAVADTGAVPWLRLVFRTPAPLLQHADSLAKELDAAAEIARTSPQRTHFQVLWQPPEGEAQGAEYAFLVKRASVALTGVRSQARVVTQPLPAEAGAIASFYAEETAAYVDGLALAPASAEAIAAASAKVNELDPGRAVVLDAVPWPADATEVLAEAARWTAAGASLVFFDRVGAAVATAADLAPTKVLVREFQGDLPPHPSSDLAPAKVLAREFQGDLSLDPYSVPTGGAEAWSFVRGEDLSLRVIARTPPGASKLDLAFPDPQLKRPGRIDPATGELADVFGQTRSAEGLRLSLSEPGRVALLRLERMSPEEIEGLAGLEEKLTVADARQMPVEEILRRLQAFEDAQKRRIQHYRALNTTHLRFQLGTGVQGLEASFEGDFFFRQGGGFDWAWQTFYVNGVRWRGKSIPEIPLVQAEKAAAMPLEITFGKEYTYRLRGSAEIDGRDCWVVDFSPAGEVVPGRSLYQGTVWVDREHYGRVRTRALQLGLEGEVLSNEETVYTQPIAADGTAAPWSPESLWLPLRVVGQQLLSVLNATTVVERETVLSRVEVNGADFEAQRQAVLASDSTMVRDTDEGLRYLVKDEESGERVVQEGFKKSRLFAVGGLFYDESQDYPLPLAGVNFFSFDFRGTGKQVNLFFAGALLLGSIAEPELFGSKWDAGANVFALAFAGSDVVFEGDEEIEAEEVESRPARVSLFLGRPLGSYGKLDLTYSLRRTDFGTADDTADDFVLPRDHFTHGLTVETKYNRSGYRLRAEASLNQRSEWEPWGRPGSPDFDDFDPATEEYTKWSAALAKTWWLPRFQKFSLELEYLDGKDLDRFSKYEFGYFADSRVHGYQSDRVRAERAYAGHVSYGFEVGEALRLQAVVDAALATDERTGLDNELLAGFGVEGNFLGPWETIVNLDLGYAIAGPDDGFSVFLAFLKLFK